MLKQCGLIGALAGALVGCGGGTNEAAPMRANATTAFEGQRLWARPIETGVQLGDEVGGEASSFSFLFGLISSGPDEAEAGGGVIALAGSLLGGAVDADPLVRSAAGDAAKKADADGIYLTHYQVKEVNILYLFSRRAAVVTGRALKLKVLGPVSRERADRQRALEAIGGGTVVLPPGAVVPFVPANASAPSKE